MKKLLYIFLSILMVACNQEDIPMVQTQEGDTVDLTFGVRVPDMVAASRAFGETATINKLSLYVFDENGYYLYNAPATLLESAADHTNIPADSKTEKRFKVTLTKSSSKRIIHFIANYTPENALTFDAEQVLVSQMTVSGSNDAYWQRMEFEGISEDTNMKKIPLVRNFAKVSVNVTATNFELINFAVVNVPMSGTVSAYNASAGAFANYTDASTYSNLNSQGYRGAMPSGVTLKNTDVTSDEIFTGTADNPVYMYERKQPEDNTYTYLLVYGTYKYDNGSKANGFYKIDLVDEGYVAYNILRNFEYKVTITDVVSAGKSSASAAASGSANNIVSTTTTKNLLNISDGVSRLYVSFTDTTLVNTDAIVLKYKYLPDVSSTTSNNGSVAISSVSSTGVVNNETLVGDVISQYTVAVADITDGWRTITITPNEPGSVSKHQTIRLKAGALVREVDLHLVQKLNMGLSCNPTQVASAINQSVDVIMTLPADIPEMYFPLVFKIEAEKLSIYPDSGKDYMPLVVGPSIVTSKNKAQSYYFTKTLEYEDYKDGLNEDGTYTLTSHFLTNKEASGSTIYVYNEYFGLNTTSFTHNGSVEPEEPSGSATTTTLTIDSSNLRGYDDSSYWKFSDIRNKTFTIYADAAYTNRLGTCSFGGSSNSGRYSLSSDLALEIPASSTTIYFVYKTSNYTYSASISVDNLKAAAGGSTKDLEFTRSGNR